MGRARDGIPIPLFDTGFYLERNPDVAASEVNPLVHYLKFGAAERRDPHPLFDTTYYLDQLAEEQRGVDNALFHYLQYGWKLGLRPSRAFDPAWITLAYPHVKAAESEFLTHSLRIAQRGVSGANVIDLHTSRSTIVLSVLSPVGSERPVGIFVHLFYDGLAEEVVRYLAAFDLPKKIYISTVSAAKKKWIERVLNDYRRILHGNCGRSQLRNGPRAVSGSVWATVS